MYGGETGRRKKVIDPSPLTNRPPLFVQLPARDPFARHRKRLGLVTLVLITRPGPRSVRPHPRTEWRPTRLQRWQELRHLAVQKGINFLD